MRGESEQQLGFSLVRPDLMVPRGHPIRTIKVLADAELRRLSPVFDQMYSRMGRPSIPPEHLLKGCLLMCLYSIRSERQLCERLRYDMLFRFFWTCRSMARHSTPLVSRTIATGSCRPMWRGCSLKASCARRRAHS